MNEAVRWQFSEKIKQTEWCLSEIWFWKNKTDNKKLWNFIDSKRIWWDCLRVKIINKDLKNLNNDIKLFMRSDFEQISEKK